jgi:hypothetical protein
VLVEALVACRWLDVNGDAAVVRIHDYEDHAPNYVKRRDYARDYMKRWREQQQADGKQDVDVNEDDINDCEQPVNVNMTTVNDCEQPVNVNITTVNDCEHTVKLPTNTNPTQPIHIKEEEEGEAADAADLSSFLNPEMGRESIFQMMDAWNEVADKIGLPRATVTDKRRKSFRTRMREPVFREGWRDALERIAGNPFLKGNNDRGWAANIDWFLSPDTVVKIFEGKYDDHGRRTPGGGKSKVSNQRVEGDIL